MAKKPKLPPGPLYGLRLPTPLPSAEKLQLDLRLPPAELEAVRQGMRTYAASRQPQLTFDGWMIVDRAIAVGEKAALKAGGGRTTSRGGYGVTLEEFLKRTGFKFVNKGVRWSLRQIRDNYDEVIAWRDSLLPSDRNHLHEPITVWQRFNEDGRKPRELLERIRPPRGKGGEKMNQLLEEYVALLGLNEQLREQAAAAEAALDSLTAVVGTTLTPTAAADVSDDMLREVFPWLSEELQEALHDRLYGTDGGDAD